MHDFDIHNLIPESEAYADIIPENMNNGCSPVAAA
jgi:hypothetical protein